MIFVFKRIFVIEPYLPLSISLVSDFYRPNNLHILSEWLLLDDFVYEKSFAHILDDLHFLFMNSSYLIISLLNNYILICLMTYTHLSDSLTF